VQDASTQSPTTGGQWSDLSFPERYRTAAGGPETNNGSAAGPNSAASKKPRVLGPFRRRLILTDLVMLLTSTLVGLLLSARAVESSLDPIFAVYSMPFIITGAWFALLVLRGAYDQRIIGLGTEEVQRVVSATLITFALVAGLSYLLRADISRAYAFISLPLGLILIIAARFFWRGWLYRARAKGRFMSRTVVVGTGQIANELEEWLTEGSYAGYLVVARYPAPKNDDDLATWVDRLDTTLSENNASAVALTPTDDATSGALRQIAWRLEGRAIDLLIAPGILDMAGPRLTVRPVAGLPLLHMDEAVLSRPQRLAKRSLDLIVGILMAIILSPVMIICAITVRLTSRGPVIFRQTRIGLGGNTFTMLKFRTMHNNADALRQELREQHDQDDPMFKLKDDPRITTPGKFLRRWSLDELPQLFNVLGGSMSLVGPRPHPIDDVDRYEANAYRRLALKPGLTGLWQVEGRSNLDWEQALQLDVYYVERWSLSGDLILLARTMRAVAQGRGAS
jgi:exopolysaccharide biosynthesis polyprenyl glycosylphosphotransferase